MLGWYFVTVLVWTICLTGMMCIAFRKRIADEYPHASSRAVIKALLCTSAFFALFPLVRCLVAIVLLIQCNQNRKKDKKRIARLTENLRCGHREVKLQGWHWAIDPRDSISTCIECDVICRKCCTPYKIHIFNWNDCLSFAKEYEEFFKPDKEKEHEH